MITTDEALEAARDCVEVGVPCTPRTLEVVLDVVERQRREITELQLRLQHQSMTIRDQQRWLDATTPKTTTRKRRPR